MTLKEAIQKLAQTGDERYAKICQVISVDTENKTADLQPLDGSSPIDDAYLQVDDKGVFVEPKVGSLVACVFVTKEMAVIVNHSQIKQFSIKIEQTEFQIDKDGFLLKTNEINFKTLLNELLTELKNAIIQTPSGVGNFSLTNKSKFDELGNKVNQLFK
ncbi:hypothetical protein [Capnocytophaga catalasegens]|uniref:Phage protein Gp138 N-terminal domain-containing protein n=1 Tax=Capnocytophaga catalasegens TaxID=1004260 RepID=A0AAV5AZX5_9FLAO|nr:hypothetical protein [Capnocytophaga catalasegens]GIZ15308.1 hypothetical protein RCZ03_13080 [Capnocytophaga catalasegens]GJM51242.1 hypothetical protein RCZ15_22150 [Capnocytophaga catalasegens]GJM53036.1 hypothetical protein RCZ16_13530 [Capnocytophaga catalasegens]